MASLTSELVGQRSDLSAGAAVGLVGGAYLTSAPLLGGPVGMPGEAVRYLLLTGLLLAGTVGAVLRWRRNLRADRAPGRAAAAGCGVAVCVLAGAAPLIAPRFGSAMVFALLLVVAAALAGGSLGLYRPEHSWHAACLAGAAAAGGATVLLAQRPQVACALGCGLAAVLLLPGCVRAEPDGGREGYAGWSRWTAGAVGAAVFGSVFAGQSLVVFRWELLGGAGARPFAYAALLAAASTCGLAVAARRRAGADSGPRGVLFASGLTAAVAACASAARPWQLTLALAAALTCGSAAAVRPESPGPRDSGPTVAALLGGATAMTAVALSGHLLDGPDTLTAVGLAPALAASAALVLRRRSPAPEASRAFGGAAGGVGTAVLEVRGLGVREPGAPAVRRLGVTVAAGEIAYLTDTLPGRRAGAVLAVLGGLRRADAGAWRLRGHDVSRVGEWSRWDLRISALVDPADTGRSGALPRGHPAASVADAVAAATAHLGPRRAAEVTPGALAAFPFLGAKGQDTCARLGLEERCLLGLAQTLIAQPALLLLDLTGPGCGPLAAEPAVTAVLRHITDRGTAVLVAVPPGQAVPGPRRLVLPAPGGSRAVLLRRTGKAMP
ncbi:hypothetical protein [Streptomyces sp. NPDC091268]|uniref:hypothetical protein n=1 Tax=Streptomyces sp. NPDC091268 TaxID=3365979 RepID=UPI0038247689